MRAQGASHILSQVRLGRERHQFIIACTSIILSANRTGRCPAGVRVFTCQRYLQACNLKCYKFIHVGGIVWQRRKPSRVWDEKIEAAG